ncbi:MAG: hypothetical protein ACFFG0_40970 [Candidatus Thorarchaeota archaeon]
MNKKRILHWIIIEESKDCTTFDGSLQSKMSKLNFDKKILDMLKCRRDGNNIRRSSAVLDSVVRKEVNSIRKYVNRRDDF